MIFERGKKEKKQHKLTYEEIKWFQD